MKFLKVTSSIWLGLIGAGLALSWFGMQKQPIMVGVLTGSSLGHMLTNRAVAAAGSWYAVKAIFAALVLAWTIVVVTAKAYAG